MDNNRKFLDFTASTKEDWKTQVLKELKGKEFDHVLWNTFEGFELDPLYTTIEIDDAVDAFPNDRGEFNYQNSWTVLQDYSGQENKEANASMLIGLQSGVQGITIDAQSNPKDYKVLLEGVHIDWIKVILNTDTGKEDLERFIEYASSKNVGLKDVRGGLNFDPLSQLILDGDWKKSKDDTLESIKSTVNLGADLWKFKTININGGLYGDKGSSVVNELAYSLALYHEYLLLLSDGTDMKIILESLHVTLSVGRSFYLELSKIKAFRVLHDQLIKTYDLQPSEINITSRSSAFEMSPIDEYNNLLRLTTQAMCAGVGGADDVMLKTYDQGNSGFSQRMSINIQMLLLEESFLTKSEDLSSGAYVIEKLIKEISQKAWTKFQEIEAQGGWLKCVEKGVLQKDIKDDAEAKVKLLNAGNRPWLGVNVFKNNNEKNWENTEIISGPNNDIKVLHTIKHNLES